MNPEKPHIIYKSKKEINQIQKRNQPKWNYIILLYAKLSSFFLFFSSWNTFVDYLNTEVLLRSMSNNRCLNFFKKEMSKHILHRGYQKDFPFQSQPDPGLNLGFVWILGSTLAAWFRPSFFNFSELQPFSFVRWETHTLKIKFED